MYRLAASLSKNRVTEKAHISGGNEAIIACSLREKGPIWGAFKSAGFDPEALWQRVDGDMELLRHLLAVFEQEFSAMLAGADRAIAKGNAAELEKASHKIKGALLQFSAHHAAEAAQQLEILGRNGTVEGAAGALEALKQAAGLLLKSLHVMTGEAAESGPCAGKV
jgi:HPt (histidine-containing phosphotransfer) domain-containing protein